MNKFKFLSLMLIALLLGACGGGSGDPTLGIGDGSGGDGGGDTGGDAPSCADEPTNPDCIPVANPPVVVLMGSGVGGTFQESIIEVTTPNIPAGGTSNISVSLVLDSDTSVYYDDAFITVNFSSNCVEAGLASIDPPSVNTGDGIATATYTAEGCATVDQITASAVVGGAPLGATGTLTVAPADVGSINFVSAAPELIGLKGTGIEETSDVIFRVVDDAGDPVGGAEVTFSLDTAVGGITFSPDTATSDSQGLVTTVVTSGTAKTTVSVTACVDVVPPICRPSDGLVISTGLPHQNGFSLALSGVNIEAWDEDGVESVVTVRLTDRYGNPVPDGTSVTFRAEAGSIAESCETQTIGDQSGVCSVTWASCCTRPDDGRVTIFAHAIGEETFKDENGNNVFDPADTTWLDMPEAFGDYNENGTFESIADEFYDYDNSKSYSPADGYFNGILCEDPARCQGSEKTGIGAHGIIIMATSGALISDNVGRVLDISSGSGTVTFYVSDRNGQPMPEGTTVKFETSNGEVFGKAEDAFDRTSNYGPFEFEFTVVTENFEPKTGPATLTVVAPSGIDTTYQIDVTIPAP
jgi:hypothetical protein